LIRQLDAGVAESVAAEAAEAATTGKVVSLLTEAIDGLVDVDLLPSKLVAQG
jgi:hypothetical protein